MFRARGCSAEESADLAQEAAIRAFMHIRRWGVTGAGLDPLLNRIARNLLIDRYRRAVPHIVPLDSADEIHDPTQDPSEEVARRQRRSAVRSAIRSLPARHAKAINYSLSGLTPEEVGQQLGIGRNAADALLHRARRSLREHLAPVRDGMWGLALGIKIRFDRVVRGSGVTNGRTAETGSLLLQSGVGAIALAVVTTLSIAAGSIPSIAGSGSYGTSSRATIVDSSSRAALPGGSSGSIGDDSGGSGSGSAEQHVFLFGAASRSAGSQGSTTTINGPKDRNGKPIATVTRRTYGQNGPDPSDPVGVTIDSVLRALCRASNDSCIGW